MSTDKLKLGHAEAQLVMRYRSARARLNADLALIDRALDLIEQLEFGLDLEIMIGEVAAFARACRAHIRRAR